MTDISLRPAIVGKSSKPERKSFEAYAQERPRPYVRPPLFGFCPQLADMQNAKLARMREENFRLAVIKSDIQQFLVFSSSRLLLAAMLTLTARTGKSPSGPHRYAASFISGIALIDAWLRSPRSYSFDPTQIHCKTRITGRKMIGWTVLTIRSI